MSVLPEQDGVVRYGPADGLSQPRYTGVRTFGRCPHNTDWPNADVAVVGAPFDTATSYRPGARFGPAAIRDQSQLLRPWHPELGLDVFAGLSVVDGGDLMVTPGNAARTATQIADGLAEMLNAGVVPLVLGGDHSIVLGELRAHAERNGPVALVLLDAHADTWDSYYGERYFHGTPFRRAYEEGLIDPSRSVLAGMRGPLYDARDLMEPIGWGMEVLTCEQLRALSAAEYGALVRERIGAGPTYLSFDIDVLDPAYAPATGTPEMMGLTTHEAVGCLRALSGIPFVGFDVVEVAPAYDGPGQITALHAASIAYEFLALMASSRREADLNRSASETVRTPESER